VLYHLFYLFRHDVSGFNVVRYITFRTAVASLTALFLVLTLGPWMIERLRRLQVGQFIREEGPQAHQTKAGTPTMGGLLILTGIIVPSLLWADLTNRNVWILILSTLSFGAIGFTDDYLKVVKKRNLGLRGRDKLAQQILVGLLVGAAVYWFSVAQPSQYSTRLIVPFFKMVMPDLGASYVFFAVMVLVFTSNAVNLTDGLDGLAIGCTLIADLHGAGLPDRPPCLLGVPRPALPAARGRGDDLLRGDGGGLHGVLVVELLPGPDLHG
jgi:phospho-N-acetylmuramoyl-pentapeptide-transferase